MRETSISDIPRWIEARILSYLNFNTLFTARVTCRRWLDMINPYFGENVILNIRLDSSPTSKRFRRGKWNGSLIAPYEEIRIIPKLENSFLFGRVVRWKNCAIEHFTNVVKFTLFEFGSVLHFIHRYMVHLPNVRYIQIRELKYDESSSETKYISTAHALGRATTYGITWYKGMGNLLQIETLRIRLFDPLATQIYMSLFTFRKSNLVNLELDFSKLYGLPLPRPEVSEIYLTVSSLMEQCYTTLRQLRLKWAVRVDTDMDFDRSDEDVEPFLEFLLALRNPVWMKLKLHQLLLTFPTVNLGMNLSDSTLIPFLLEQEGTLKRVCLSRVLPDSGIHHFANSFPPSMLNKLEFAFYFNEVDLSPQPVTVVRSVEVLLTETAQVDLHRLTGVNRGRRENGLKYYVHLKLMNAHGNLAFIKPDILRLTEYFYSVRTLELLDNSTFGRIFVQFTSSDFNTIMRKMPRLVSLKMSNASKFTDVGITKIAEKKIKHMLQSGTLYVGDRLCSAPVAGAKELRFLDLRDLSPNVTDISVFFAFQHITKLEKISFDGCHSITEWGKQILDAKYRRNPFFDVIFKSTNNDNNAYGNYSLPCIDFP